MTITVGNSNITLNDSTVQTTAYLGNKGQLFTSNGTFTIPSGITALKITVVGGGGGTGGVWGGGDPSETAGSGGGGGGGTAVVYLTGLTPTATLSVTIGAGGTAGTAGSFPSVSNGGSGGTSSVASGTQSITTVSATGGSGSSGVAGGATDGGVGGVGSNGTLNINGSTGTKMSVANSAYLTGGNGGGTTLAGNSPRGTAGYVYGGGAGGAYANYGSSANGSVGGAGAVVFEW